MEGPGQPQAPALNPGFWDMDENPELQLQNLHIYKVIGATTERPDCCEESCPRLFWGVLQSSCWAGLRVVRTVTPNFFHFNNHFLIWLYAVMGWEVAIRSRRWRNSRLAILQFQLVLCLVSTQRTQKWRRWNSWYRLNFCCMVFKSQQYMCCLKAGFDPAKQA